jgi:hypothetical protein
MTIIKKCSHHAVPAIEILLSHHQFGKKMSSNSEGKELGLLQGEERLVLLISNIITSHVIISVKMNSIKNGTFDSEQPILKSLITSL